MVVVDIEVTDPQRSSSFVKVDLNRIVPCSDHPEHIIAVHMHVVVVNLLSEIGRSNLTGIQVQSNKGERAYTQSAIRSDEFALAETHISPEGQARGRALLGVRSGSATMNIR